jgi:hypothetical protein
MRVAVIQDYAKGVKVGTNAPEQYGILTIAGYGQRNTLQATLKQGQNMTHTLIPPLWQVTVAHCIKDLIWFNGYQFMDKAWYFQRWRCRLVTAQETYVAELKRGPLDALPEIATYRHWWGVLEQARSDAGSGWVMDIADAVAALDIELDQVWNFIGWIGATNRGYGGPPGGGREGLGTITFKGGEPCDGVPKDSRYG